MTTLAPGTTPRLLLAAALLAASLAQAQEAAPVAPIDPATHHDPAPLWEIGLAGIAAWQPAYPGSDVNIGYGRALPYAIYRGSVLRLDGGGIGLRALRTPRFEWDVSASGAFGSSANQVKVREGMPSIGLLGEIGPALKVNLGDLLVAGREPRKTQLELPIRAVFEASHGIRHEGWSFEPRLTHTAWEGDRASVRLSASALFGDRHLNHLFYGVDEAYATPDRPQYDAKPGLVATRLGVALHHRLTHSLRVLWFAQLESVDGAANVDSPLVRRRQDAGAGVSLVWAAWESAQAGAE